MLKRILDFLMALFGRKPKAVIKPAKALPPALSEKPVWVRGKTGPEVKETQKKLINLGLEVSGGSDGLLGEYTEEAIEDFKSEYGIVEDGIGERTLQAIDAKYAELEISEDLILRIGDDDEDFKGDDDPDNDGQVSRYQEQLILLGHDLPRFGADGSFGEESLISTKEFQAAHRERCGSEDAFKDQGVGPKTYAAVFATTPVSKSPKTKPLVPPPPIAFGSLPENPPKNMVVTKDRHVLTKGSGTRALAEITGATLHQTACVLGENEDRWANVGCHFGITRSGKIIYNTDLLKKVWHGNGFNSKTIGIEIDGHFAGLESQDADGNWVPDLKTYWRPKSAPDRMPLSITEAQVEACKALLRWLKRLVDAAGGNFRYLVAHRQSSASRVSDPGEKTWKLVVVPLLEELNMSDGGDDYYILDNKGKAGKPIPGNWDEERHPGVKYKPKTSALGRKKTGP